MANGGNPQNPQQNPLPQVDQRGKFRIWTPPKHWQEYLSSILVLLFLPLLPLFIEKWETGEISEASLTFGTSIYAISVGASSKSLLQFIFAAIISIIFAVSFGSVITEMKVARSANEVKLDGLGKELQRIEGLSTLTDIQKDLLAAKSKYDVTTKDLFDPPKGLSNESTAAWISLVLIFVFHAVERYNRHVFERRPFWEFKND